jgi:membrane-associated protease RseP (regulator of RpoE activity)
MGSAVRKQKLAGELREKADRLEDSPERQMVRRAIAGYIAMIRERLSDLLKQEEYDRATGLLEMAELLRPRQARTLFDLARTYAFRGMKNRALDVLDQAAAAGFRDAALAETDPAFVKLRDDPRFKEILARILSNVPRPEGPMVAEIATPVLLDPSTSSYDFTPSIAVDQSAPSGKTGPPSEVNPAEQTLQLPVVRVSAILASVELRPFHLPNPESEDLPISFLRVERVRPDTAAARAGVEAGMEITAIQGVRLRGMTDSDLSEAMAKPVKNGITLSVRDPPRSREREIQIKLKKSRSASAGKTND